MSTNANANPFAPPIASLDGEAAADTEFHLNLFSPEGRIGRVRYLLYSIVLTIPIMIVGGVLSAFLGIFGAFLLYAAIIYVHIMLAIKRSHDFDASGWMSLLVLVPLVSLLFLFVPGTDGPNRFGLKTAPNGRTGLLVILLLVGGIFVVGILAAIALPAYQQYVQRAKVMQHQR